MTLRRNDKLMKLPVDKIISCQNDYHQLTKCLVDKITACSCANHGGYCLSCLACSQVSSPIDPNASQRDGSERSNCLVLIYVSKAVSLLWTIFS